jgi:hypothetical protein
MTTAGKSLGAIKRIVVYRLVQDLPAMPPPSAEVTTTSKGAPAAPSTDTAATKGTLAPETTDTSSAKAATPPVTGSTATAKSAPAPAATSAASAPSGPFAKVPVIGPAQFNREKTKLDSIEGAALKAATSGSRLLFEDTPELHSKDGKPVRLNYAVVTEAPAARGDLSNIVAIVPVDVPVQPADLAATAKPEGIVLTWTAPTQTVGGAPKPFLIGYNIYRAAPGEEPGDLDKPVNATPIEKETYTDVPAYGSFQYFVTAIPISLGVSVESDLSTGATATFKDLIPPGVPAGLNALVEPHAVQLVWDAVEAPDLAGYKVYRTEGTGIDKLTPVATISLTKDPITPTTFRDTTINVGISYFYEVTSVDKSGNESKRAKTDWVLSPKTP